MKRKSRKSKVRYNPNTVGSDIHIRVFSSMIVLTAVLTMTYIVMLVNCKVLDKISNSNLMSTNYDYEDGKNEITFHSYVGGTIHITNHLKLIHVNVFTCKELLFLSGDIELNPGPLTESSEEKILCAISASENRITAKIDKVQQELENLKCEVRKVKQDCSENKREIIDTKQKQQDILWNVERLNDNMQHLTDEYERLTLDVDHLSTELEIKNDKIDKLEMDAEMFEKESLKHRMRIFGLKENVQETERES
jgi:peptidoglycan hydrolase CwlO-like protein